MPSARVKLIPIKGEGPLSIQNRIGAGGNEIEPCSGEPVFQATSQSEVAMTTLWSLVSLQSGPHLADDDDDILREWRPFHGVEVDGLHPEILYSGEILRTPCGGQNGSYLDPSPPTPASMTTRSQSQQKGADRHDRVQLKGKLLRNPTLIRAQFHGMILRPAQDPASPFEDRLQLIRGPWHTRSNTWHSLASFCRRGYALLTEIKTENKEDQKTRALPSPTTLASGNSPKLPTLISPDLDDPNFGRRRVWSVNFWRDRSITPLALHLSWALVISLSNLPPGSDLGDVVSGRSNTYQPGVGNSGGTASGSFTRLPYELISIGC